MPSSIFTSEPNPRHESLAQSARRKAFRRKSGIGGRLLFPESAPTLRAKPQGGINVPYFGPVQLKLLHALRRHGREATLESLAAFAAGLIPTWKPGRRTAGLRPAPNMSPWPVLWPPFVAVGWSVPRRPEPPEAALNGRGRPLARCARCGDSVTPASG